MNFAGPFLFLDLFDLDSSASLRMTIVYFAQNDNRLIVFHRLPLDGRQQIVRR